MPDHRRWLLIQGVAVPGVRRFRLPPFFLFAALLAFLAGACEGETARSQVPEKTGGAVAVAVRTVEPETLEDVFILPGETEAYQDVRLASDLNGLVEWIGPE